MNIKFICTLNSISVCAVLPVAKLFWMAESTSDSNFEIKFFLLCVYIIRLNECLCRKIEKTNDEFGFDFTNTLFGVGY